MTGKPVCQRIKQYRSFFLFKYFSFSFESINDRQRIKTVNTLCMHLFRIRAGPDSGENIVTHCLAVGLSAHAVLVIKKIEYEFQSAFILAFPQILVLIHGCQSYSFPYGSAPHRCIAYIRNNNPFFSVDLFIQSGPDGDIGGTAHNSVVRINAERSKKGMH